MKFSVSAWVVPSVSPRQSSGRWLGRSFCARSSFRSFDGAIDRACFCCRHRWWLCWHCLPPHSALSILSYYTTLGVILITFAHGPRTFHWLSKHLPVPPQLDANYLFWQGKATFALSAGRPWTSRANQNLNKNVIGRVLADGDLGTSRWASIEPRYPPTNLYKAITYIVEQIDVGALIRHWKQPLSIPPSLHNNHDKKGRGNRHLHNWT